LPYEKAWEIQHGKEFVRTDIQIPGNSDEERNNNDDNEQRKNTRRITFWKDYGFQYLKGKQFSLYDLCSRRTNPKTGHCRYTRRVRIYDVFGFFQSSFLRAIRSMPGVATAQEYETVEKGKAERGEFYQSNIAEIKEYTRHELMLLCRMMSQLRQALQGQNLYLTTWFGAGSIAQALMKRENVAPHVAFKKASNIEKVQEYAHRAFFGGRIELIQQGHTHERLYGYDIASAYPSIAADLSSMEGGAFIRCDAGRIQSLDRLSLVRLRATFVQGMPFYPLPYRTPQASILFPRETHGVYMVEEVRAAIEFTEKFGGNIDIEEVYEFVPATDIKPFTFLQQLFDYRQSLAGENITQIVIKLGINSVYGKLAQSVGQFGKAPTFASPWHAAAITAGTRAQLLQAAMHDCGAIVMLATDGIVSTRPLPLAVPVRKTLGAWEAATLPAGGTYVQSGVYAYTNAKGELTAKSRGFRPANVTGSIAEHLRTAIPAAWKAGHEIYSFPYENYMTLGASCVSRETWDRRGSWVTSTRDLDLVGAGVKRDSIHYAIDRRRRASRLIPTTPSERYLLLVDEHGNMPLSEPHKTEWLDFDFGMRQTEETDQENILAGFS
jgi:hypothetical protein